MHELHAQRGEPNQPLPRDEDDDDPLQLGGLLALQHLGEESAENTTNVNISNSTLMQTSVAPSVLLNQIYLHLQVLEALVHLEVLAQNWNEVERLQNHNCYDVQNFQSQSNQNTKTFLRILKHFTRVLRI
jgi:hypothetical protein